MNWREFKRQPDGFKGCKGFNSSDTPLKPLKPLMPSKAEVPNMEEKTGPVNPCREPEGLSNNQFPALYAHTRARENGHEQPHPLAEESRKRFAFCVMHRRLQGGECHRQDVIDGRQGGNREAALNGCFLWQVVKTEPRLDRLAGVEVLEGITVADCLAMLADCKEPPDLLRQDRRWFLIFAASIRKQQKLATLKTPGVA